MSTIVASPPVTFEQVWGWLFKRKCRVGEKTKPGVYGRRPIHAYRATAKQFGLTVRELMEIINQPQDGKWVRFSANRLSAGKLRRESRSRHTGAKSGSARKPNRKRMTRGVRPGTFAPSGSQVLPIGWTDPGPLRTPNAA